MRQALNAWENHGLDHLRAIALAVQRSQLYQRGMEWKTNITPDHDIECRTNVAMHNATVQQPFTMMSPNSNPIIVMLQAEAGFVSKHNDIQFRCP
ncbi:hypothetical protein TNCV_2219151 [Trichonephila clavipes]|nr:hypothetical protein TNCV_2219151 [Trichonephila clavipes]